MVKRNIKKLINSMVQSGNFCRIMDTSCEKDGYMKGSKVYIAGLKVIPIDEKDPYIQKIYVIANPLVDGKIVPEDMVLMDPMVLRKVGSGVQTKLEEALKDQFGDKT